MQSGGIFNHLGNWLPLVIRVVYVSDRATSHISAQPTGHLGDRLESLHLYRMCDKIAQPSPCSSRLPSCVIGHSPFLSPYSISPSSKQVCLCHRLGDVHLRWTCVLLYRGQLSTWRPGERKSSKSYPSPAWRSCFSKFNVWISDWAGTQAAGTPHHWNYIIYF